jgi:hypothetical protein
VPESCLNPQLPKTVPDVSPDPRWQVPDFHDGEDGVFWVQTCGRGIVGSTELAWLKPRPFAVWVAAGDPAPPAGISPAMLAEILGADLALPRFTLGSVPGREASRGRHRREVVWEGGDGSGGMLPEGRFGNVQRVPVAAA